MDKLTTVSINQLRRYPIYLKCLISFRDAGCETISAPQIAKALGYNEEQVKKDLRVVSSSGGTPKKGRDIKKLISDLEDFLGYNNSTSAIIVGVGKLGEAFMCYKGFAEYGLDILAGFDVDPHKIGEEVNGKPIFSLEKLENLIPRLNVRIAILTTPSSEAQEVANRLVASGVKAIWNFVPVHLDVPDSVILEDVNLACSLASLSHKLNKESKRSI